MAAYQQARDDQVLPIYEFTTQLATMEAPPVEMQQLLGAMRADQAAMDDFASITAGTISPAEFFDPANIGRIMSGSATATVGSAPHLSATSGLIASLRPWACTASPMPPGGGHFSWAVTMVAVQPASMAHATGPPRAAGARGHHLATDKEQAMSLFAVNREAGPAWMDGTGAFDQSGATHAAFMNGLAEEGFILAAGPLAGTESSRIACF